MCVRACVAEGQRCVVTVSAEQLCERDFGVTAAPTTSGLKCVAGVCLCLVCAISLCQIDASPSITPKCFGLSADGSYREAARVS